MNTQRKKFTIDDLKQAQASLERTGIPKNRPLIVMTEDKGDAEIMMRYVHIQVYHLNGILWKTEELQQEKPGK